MDAVMSLAEAEPVVAMDAVMCRAGAGAEAEAEEAVAMDAVMS